MHSKNSRTFSKVLPTRCRLRVFQGWHYSSRGPTLVRSVPLSAGPRSSAVKISRHDSIPLVCGTALKWDLHASTCLRAWYRTSAAVVPAHKWDLYASTCLRAWYRTSAAVVPAHRATGAQLWLCSSTSPEQYTHARCHIPFLKYNCTTYRFRLACVVKTDECVFSRRALYTCTW